MKARSRVAGAPPAAEENFLASVSDLMSGLLMVFIILLMTVAYRFMSAEKLQRDTVDKLQAADRERRVRLEHLKHALENEGIQVSIDKDNGILRMPEAVLFDTGKARFRPGGEAKLKILARELEKAVQGFQALDAVLVEGHTDSSPIVGGVVEDGSLYRDNWDLSFARAKHTYKMLLTLSAQLGRHENARHYPLLSLAAYGESRPAVDGSGDEAMRQNRRIEIRFVLDSPTSIEKGSRP